MKTFSTWLENKATKILVAEARAFTDGVRGRNEIPAKNPLHPSIIKWEIKSPDMWPYLKGLPVIFEYWSDGSYHEKWVYLYAYVVVPPELEKRLNPDADDYLDLVWDSYSNFPHKLPLNGMGGRRSPDTRTAILPATLNELKNSFYKSINFNNDEEPDSSATDWTQKVNVIKTGPPVNRSWDGD